MVSSNERIDHAAEARRELEFTESQFRDINGNPSGVGFEKALVAATQAQVHATLALVEQQRIANLLTYYAVDDMIGGGPGSRGAMEDIEKGLGLDWW